MRSPQGFTVTTALLERAPSLAEAIELMPAPPPRNSDIELLRAWEAAMRWWLSGPLWMAKARHREFIDHDAGKVRHRGGTQQEPGPGTLVPPGRRAAGLRGGAGAAPGAAPALTGRRMLTLREVCAAAEVSAATVRKAVFRTRQGLAQAGDAGYLPRAYMTGRGFRREDVSAWIAARERPAVTQPARAAALRRLGHAG